MSGSPTISITKALSIVRGVERLGIDPTRLYAALGVTAQTPCTIDTHVSYDRYLEAWELAMRACQDPGFPLQVAQVPVEEYELAGFLALTSATIEQAFTRVSRFQRLWMSAGHWADAVERAGAIVLRWIPPRVESGAGLAERCAAECAMARLLVGIRALAQAELGARAVTFAHRAPRDTGAHRALFGVSCRFSAPAYTLTLAEEVFALPVPTMNVPLSDYLEHQCEGLLERFEGGQDVSKRVAEALTRGLPDDAPTVKATARSLGMTARTLQRRLADEGTSFHAILDETRCDLAHRHLGSGRLSVAEVAHLTGFASVSAFYRAYRRWTGELPSSSRAKPPLAAP